MWIATEYDGVDITRAVEYPQDDEPIVGNAEIGAILSKRMHAQAWPDPIAGNTCEAVAGDPMHVGDEGGDEPLGSLRAVAGNVVVDAIEVGARRLGQNE